jgi:flagellar hook assembly protein FlgD
VARGAVPFDLYVAEDGPVRAAVYEPSGRKLSTVQIGRLTGGHHRFVWDPDAAGGRAAPSGVYLLQVVSADDVRSARVTLLR